MIYLKNEGKTVIGFAGKHLIPGASALAFENSAKDHPVIAKKIKAGELVLVEAEEAQGESEEKTEKTVNLSRMNKKQLLAYAQENGIEIDETKSNALIAKAIEEALAEE